LKQKLSQLTAPAQKGDQNADCLSRKRKSGYAYKNHHGRQIAFCVDRYTEASVMEQINLKCANTIVENVKKIV